MGQARLKSRNRRRILLGEERCVYCLARPSTVEHMPPTSMFPGRQRLSGMEFAACEDCNHSSRAADAAASFFARISPTNVINELELAEARKLIGTLADIAPGFVREVFDESKTTDVWMRGRDSVLGPKKQILADGPVTLTLLHAFSAKLAMALYREHIGRALSVDGIVFARHYLNAGLSRQQAEATLSILPGFGELRQGAKRSGKSFNYRYNTDDRSIVAALVAFNDNFFVRLFATEDPEIANALLEAHDLPPVRIGDLTKMAVVWKP